MTAELREQIIKHHCPPSDWMQGAISIVWLSKERGQIGTGWHIVFWKSATEWDKFLSIIFCPYCGMTLEKLMHVAQDAAAIEYGDPSIAFDKLIDAARKWAKKLRR